MKYTKLEMQLTNSKIVMNEGVRDKKKHNSKLRLKGMKDMNNYRT